MSDDRTEGLVAHANAEIERARKHPLTPQCLREHAERERAHGRPHLAEALEAWARRIEAAT